MALDNQWCGGIIFGLGILAATSAGCGIPSPGPKAASALGCSKEQVAVEDVNGYVKIASGCGKKDVLSYDGDKWGSLRERAAFELTCGQPELEITVLSNDTFGVTGCDRKAVYKYAPYVGVVLESTSQGNGPPTMPPPSDKAK